MNYEDLNVVSRTIKENIDLGSMEFKPLKDYIDKEINVDGFFFTEGKYGKQVVVVGNGAKINMPSRAVESFEKIENDETLLNGVLEGHLKLVEIKPIKTKNGETTAFKFASC